YSGHDFPNLPQDASCPLCQNELGQTGLARLARFDIFIKQAAETAANEARELATKAYKEIKHAGFDLMFRDALVEELTEIDATVAAECTSMQDSLIARQQSVLQAAAAELLWENIVKLPID